VYDICNRCTHRILKLTNTERIVKLTNSGNVTYLLIVVILELYFIMVDRSVPKVVAESGCYDSVTLSPKVLSFL